MISILINAKQHNSVLIMNYSSCSLRLIMLYIYTRIRENGLNGFRVIPLILF